MCNEFYYSKFISNQALIIQINIESIFRNNNWMFSRIVVLPFFDFILYIIWVQCILHINNWQWINNWMNWINNSSIMNFTDRLNNTSVSKRIDWLFNVTFMDKKPLSWPTSEGTLQNVEARNCLVVVLAKCVV